jgi:hypothetical protein
MDVTYPLLLIVLGIVVLLLGKRIAVLGAAVGALLGVVLLNIFPASGSLFWEFVAVGGLAIAGFFLAGLAKGIVDIVLIVLCALAGAVILVEFLDFFPIVAQWQWLFAIVGGLIGWMIYRRFHDMALIILAGLIGGLLVTRGLIGLIPSFTALQGWLGTLLAIVLAGGGIGYQSGYFANRKAAQVEAAQAQAAAAPAQTPPTAAPAPTQAGDMGAPTPPPVNG